MPASKPPPPPLTSLADLMLDGVSELPQAIVPCGPATMLSNDVGCFPKKKATIRARPWVQSEEFSLPPTSDSGR